MNAMVYYMYDPKVSYKNNLVFIFMNFNGNFRNRNEKVEKLNGEIHKKKTCVLAIKSQNMLKIASTGCYDTILSSYTTR